LADTVESQIQNSFEKEQKYDLTSELKKIEKLEAAKVQN